MKCRIWSNDKEMWWANVGAGYVKNIEDATVLFLTEAFGVARAEMRQQPPNHVIVPLARRETEVP